VRKFVEVFIKFNFFSRQKLQKVLWMSSGEKFSAITLTKLSSTKLWKSRQEEVYKFSLCLPKQLTTKDFSSSKLSKLSVVLGEKVIDKKLPLTNKVFIKFINHFI